ncbi:Disease resistance protein [Melia azedarach]|uniref:Disease resistance protein n=1 Tax=Melia azedarach TaxID=155640 RepID=A0ACC1YGH4_MELAZ|nr:Disease resistance protein [Melia azedarach]
MLKIEGEYYGSKSNTKVDGNQKSTVIKNLNMCSDLKHILKEYSNMDHLIHLQVRRCHNLINVVASSTSFGNLTALRVWSCKGLTTVVTSSTAKSLVRLRELSIDCCDMLTELVIADEEEETKDREIVFRELKVLQLFYLESLISFCSANYTLTFPSLEELTVEECPKMKIFSGGKSSTPKLQKIKRNWKDKGCWKGDLNTTVKELHEEMRTERSRHNRRQR